MYRSHYLRKSAGRWLFPPRRPAVLRLCQWHFPRRRRASRFDPVNELGVVTHNNKNYYLPAFSTIYAGSGRKSDKYELISQLIYKEIPVEKRCNFEQWASLMDRVYKINNNGKWAILFAIMCAFRSNIHCIDRLFTAPFFMGPMSSGKRRSRYPSVLFSSPRKSPFST